MYLFQSPFVITHLLGYCYTFRTNTGEHNFNINIKRAMYIANNLPNKYFHYILVKQMFKITAIIYVNKYNT